MAEPRPAGLVVRLAVPADLAQVGEVTVLAYRADDFIDDASGYTERLRDAASRARDAELWVAVDGDDETRVLGSVTFCPIGSPYRELARDDEGEFRMLAVDPAARGIGVGRALVERCLARSRELGFQKMVLCSLPEMLTAHGLYVSLGFERDESRDWRPVDDVVLLAFTLRLDT